MKNLNPLLVLAPIFALVILLLPGRAAAADNNPNNLWSINLTPVLLFPTNAYRFGGGADPEVKYTIDLGGARLSAGGRIGSYYAKNLFGVTVMPTLRLMVPVGPLEPYAAFGLGYGFLPKTGYSDFATMSRLGIVFRFSKRFAIGLEGTVQNIEGSKFRFPSLGSMMSFDL